MSSSSSLGLADQANPAADRQSAYLRVHAVNIYVRDQERSLRFYLEQLGFSLAFDVCLQSGQRWLAVAPPDGTAVLNLIAPEPESEEYKLIGRPSGVVFVTEDVAARYLEWRQRGVRFRHTPRLRRVKYQRQALELGANASLLLGKQTPIWGGVFTRFEDVDKNSFALVSFDEMSQAVEAQRRAAAEKLESERRAAYELEIAKQVQAGLFPQTLPSMNTLDYGGICIQARQVGGDYYDFINLGRERLGLVLGDISGKGIASALLMANLQANLRSQCAVLAEPERLLRSVNQLFYDNTPDSAYASLVFAEYDDATQRLRYANCGHLSALLLRDDRTLARLDSTCTVMGLFQEWECVIAECRLFSGDTLALYTDGITESFNAAGEEFGEERLIAALRRHRALSSRDLRAAIVNEVRQFSPHEQYDDITLIVAKCATRELTLPLPLA
ncbi:MAG TPA: SpoIIE family protein phosphatase [Verrucomicrobiae bacterium]|jgi:serine phosphatase RsbU (regulator of sigma subunit)|nr:SpoIIE family protein phosphatase [Verrucomicrobiae bacterium]